MGLVTDQAQLFLTSLAPVEDAMGSLKFEDVEKQLDLDRNRRRQIGGY